MLSIESPNHSNAMLQSMYTAYKEGRYCDMKLQIHQYQLPIHRIVLAGLSEYFKVLLEKAGKETIEINVPESEAGICNLKKIVDFAYTGRLDLQKADVKKIMILANIFKVSSIQRFCEDQIIRNVSNENCVEEFLFANMHDFEYIKQYCIRIIGERFETITLRKEFLDIPSKALIEILEDDGLVVLREETPLFSSERELVLLRGALHYISGNCDINSKGILKCIRFPLINRDDICTEFTKWERASRLPETEDIVQLLQTPWKENYPKTWTKTRDFSRFSFMNVPTIFASGAVNSHNEHILSITCDDISISDCICAIEVYRKLKASVVKITGFAVEYISGTKKTYGGRANRDNHFVKSEKIQLMEGEMINDVSGSFGTHINELQFHTSTGRTLAFRGSIQGEFPIPLMPVSPKHLHGFTGTTVQKRSYSRLVKVGLIWKYYEPTKTCSSSTD